MFWRRKVFFNTEQPSQILRTKWDLIVLQFVPFLWKTLNITFTKLALLNYFKFSFRIVCSCFLMYLYAIVPVPLCLRVLVCDIEVYSKGENFVVCVQCLHFDGSTYWCKVEMFAEICNLSLRVCPCVCICVCIICIWVYVFVCVCLCACFILCVHMCENGCVIITV